MKSIFILRRDGTFLDEIREGSDPTSHPILKGLTPDMIYAEKEITERFPDGSWKNIRYRAQQSPQNPDYLRALREALIERGFDAYLFSEDKSKIARLLIEAQIKPRDTLEFLDMLVAAPEPGLGKLYAGLKEDLGKSPGEQ